MKKKNLWAVCYGLALTAFTVYISLDTFVLTETYQTDTTQMNTSLFEDISANALTEETAETEIPVIETEQTVPQSGRKHSRHGVQEEQETTEENTVITAEPETSGAETYQDENCKITLTEYYENNTRIYVADVVLLSAEYLKTAFADDTYGKNVTEKTSSIAEAHNAILAMNGDYYGAQERGYVIRNGIVYRDTKGSNDVLCIYADGTMQIISPDDYTAEELVSMSVWQAFSFGPGLIQDGTVTVTQNQEVGKAMASNPRTAVGIIDSNHYVFVVSDGRTSESEGLSLYQLAEFMQGLGVETAYNLDGGGSSTMYFNGEVINQPTTNGKIKEREVSDIVYIG